MNTPTTTPTARALTEQQAIGVVKTAFTVLSLYAAGMTIAAILLADAWLSARRD